MSAPYIWLTVLGGLAVITVTLAAREVRHYARGGRHTAPALLKAAITGLADEPPPDWSPADEWGDDEPAAFTAAPVRPDPVRYYADLAWQRAMATQTRGGDQRSPGAATTVAVPAPAPGIPTDTAWSRAMAARLRAELAVNDAIEAGFGRIQTEIQVDVPWLFLRARGSAA